MQTPFTQVHDWFPWENAGASIAVADVDADGRPDVVLLMVDAPPGRNAGYYRVGRALDESDWPMYGHLFLLADGRVFYSGGQYGDNNGVRPAVWNLETNATVDVPGLPDPGSRNQSASVLLPPAQAQQVMIIGGGPYDMHDQAGATAATAVADLADVTAAAPAYARTADLHMGRMHLCATLLPDRTVLVNGGAMMEETAAQAAFGAEIYHPAAGEWRMAADSRVPRLYHSVAVLLPDGRVVTAGSNPQRKTEEMRVEVFWPPYLFAGPRPSVVPAQQEVTYGAVLAATVPGAAAVASAALMRPVATTHSSDLEQRLVDLPLTVVGAVPAHGARRGGKTVARGVGPPEVRGDETR